MPASTLTLVDSFKEALPEKIHNLGSDVIKFALTNAANPPVVANTELGDLTIVSLANLLGDDTVITVSSSQTAGTYTFDLADETIEATGGTIGPFRYVVLYNDTATNDEIIGWYDYGSDLTLNDGEQLSLTFNASGVLTISDA